jgi:hypothetical protein
MVSGRMATAHTWRKTRARLHRVRLRKCHYSGAQRRSLAVWLWFGGQMGARLDALFSWGRALVRVRVHPMTGQRSRLRFMSPGKIIPEDEIVEICPVPTDILWVFAEISTYKAEGMIKSEAQLIQADEVPESKVMPNLVSRARRCACALRALWEPVPASQC